MKIYLDVCCLKRSFDDQTQARILLETEAIELIFNLVWLGKLSWCSSEIVDYENQRNPNLDRRLRIGNLLQRCEEIISITPEIEQRGIELEKLGFRAMDSLHLASAEAAKVDAFLTCDDRLYRRAERFKKQLKIRVENPVLYITEVI
jgi:predicted nucleic acid-binding protein